MAPIIAWEEPFEYQFDIQNRISRDIYGYYERCYQKFTWIRFHWTVFELCCFALKSSVSSTTVSLWTRVHHYPSKVAFHCLENFSIPKALDLKSTLLTLISKVQKPISKNRILSLRLEKKLTIFRPAFRGLNLNLRPVWTGYQLKSFMICFSFFMTVFKCYACQNDVFNNFEYHIH